MLRNFYDENVFNDVITLQLQDGHKITILMPRIVKYYKNTADDVMKL